MSKISIDLHDCFNQSEMIEKQLKTAFQEGLARNADYIEIIHGKGSGQLKKRVDRYLQLPDIKKLYKRVKHDPKNFGRLFVYL